MEYIKECYKKTDIVVERVKDLIARAPMVTERSIAGYLVPRFEFIINGGTNSFDFIDYSSHEIVSCTFMGSFFERLLLLFLCHEGRV